MKIQVRKGVFETNSSSVHSLTLVTGSDYDKWEKGELIYDRWRQKLVPITDEIKEERESEEMRYLTSDEFYDDEYIDCETFEESMTTPSGEEVVAFGYYGYDGW